MSIDRYGRTVAMVTCDAVIVNWRQVQDGLAWCFHKYLTQPATCLPLEREARDAKRGYGAILIQWHRGAFALRELSKRGHDSFIIGARFALKTCAPLAAAVSAPDCIRDVHKVRTYLGRSVRRSSGSSGTRGPSLLARRTSCDDPTREPSKQH